MRSLALLLALAATACGGDDPMPGEFTPAVSLDSMPPIPYPADLFEQRVEGEVMLYLVIDSSGYVVRDSTRIETSSGRPAFDAAALEAAPALRFAPARRGDTAVTAPLQVPIRFTLPDSLQAGEGR
jgi:protein TonB